MASSTRLRVIAGDRPSSAAAPPAESPLRDVVTGELRQAILSGRYKPGQRLVEDRLAEDFGVSRNPVREALRSLAAEGLVALTARRGATVAAPSPEDALAMIEVRATLEALNARHAARRRDPQVIDLLSAVLREGAGGGGGGERRGRGGPTTPPAAHSTDGCSNVCAASTTEAAGSTTRFGITNRSTSVAETATSAAQNTAATAASHVRPNFRTQPAISSAVTASTSGYRQGMVALQCRQRPRSTANESSGTLSYHASSALHDMHAEPGLTIERFRGMRAATTFKKLPIARPGKMEIAAKAPFAITFGCSGARCCR
jgi:DNA-binding transcriptional regulator YhcF (GntR family)